MAVQQSRQMYVLYLALQWWSLSLRFHCMDWVALGQFRLDTDQLKLQDVRILQTDCLRLELLKT